MHGGSNCTGPAQQYKECGTIECPSRVTLLIRFVVCPVMEIMCVLVQFINFLLLLKNNWKQRERVSYLCQIIVK